MPNLVNESIQLLGRYGTDKITKVSGPITSICFDLYGCIQVCIERGLDKDGKRHESFWYDISRIDLEPEKNRVMALPTQYIDKTPASPSNYGHGPAEKPSPVR
jgi:hypothetical protein